MSRIVSNIVKHYSVPKHRRHLMEVATAAVVGKSIGSMFRINDDRTAPKEIFNNTVRRELTMLAIAGIGATMAHAAVIPLGRSLGMKKFFKKHKPLVTGAIASVGYGIAEVVSRMIAPKDYWSKLKKNGSLSPNKPVLNQRAPVNLKNMVEVPVGQPTFRSQSLASLRPFSYNPAFARTSLKLRGNFDSPPVLNHSKSKPSVDFMA